MTRSSLPCRPVARTARSLFGSRPASTAIALALLLLSVPDLQAQSFLDWKGLRPGPHAVGFRAIATTDATRSYGAPADYEGRPRPQFGDRPLQVALWYPAESGSTAAFMTYDDYVALLAWEVGPPLTAAEDRRSAQEQFERMSGLPVTTEARAAFDALYRERVWARRDATPAAGRFPVLIYAPGQGYPVFDNSVLAELLASHGFVVLTSPSAGPDTREMPDSPLAIDAGSRDLEFLAGFAHTLPQADLERLAAMGFSLGGSSAALFTLRNARVKAFISLDGVLRDDRYLPVLEAFPQFEPGNLRASLLWIACAAANSLPGFGEGSFPDQARYADLVKAVFPGLLHHDFSSMSSLQRRRAQSPTTDWTSATASYEAAARLILGFLENRLLGLERPLDREPESLCKVSFRPALKAPPTPADFRETVGRDGALKGADLLRRVRSEHADRLPFFEEPLILLAYEELGAGRGALARELFTLAEEIFPASIDASYGLGKAYFAEGSFEEAEPHYRAAREKLERDPNIPAEQKAAILARIDKILDDLRGKRETKP